MGVFSGATIAGNVLPDVTGRDLGSPTQRWDFFAQSLGITNLEAIRFTDQFVGTTLALRVTAAETDLGSNPGLIVIPSTESSGSFTIGTSYHGVLDLRGNTGNGGLWYSRQLAGTEQYGAIFSTTSLAADGHSSTALAGIVAPGISGMNVVGVRGEVSSAVSAGVFGYNNEAGAGVQGDTSPNKPGSIGVLGTSATGATSGSPSIAVKGLSTGSAVTDTTIAGLFVNDNGLPVLASISAAHGSSTSPVAIKASSGLDTATEIEINNSTAGGKSWRWRGSGVSDPLTGSAGALSLYNQTNNRVPFSVDPACPSNTLKLTSTGIQINSGTSITGIVVYSQTVTPSAVNAATAAEQDFTVTGVTTADKIIVNPVATGNATAVCAARVKSANTVSIQFVNPTAGSLTPGAGTYTFIAVRS